MSAQTTVTPTRVSLREVKEESYRALRFCGFSWGQAQLAGRVAGISQVLWGTGVSEIVLESKRFRASRRTPKTSRSDSYVTVDARGCRAHIFAPIAFALLMGERDSRVMVSAAAATKEVASALWDMEEFSKSNYFFGYDSDFANGYSIRAGDLFMHGEPQKKKSKSWWLTSVDIPGGSLILSADQRTAMIANALRSGVEVDSQDWSNLKKVSWKFLVPEK